MTHMPTWMTSFHHLLSVARVFQEFTPRQALLGPTQLVPNRSAARTAGNRLFVMGAWSREAARHARILVRARSERQRQREQSDVAFDGEAGFGVLGDQVAVLGADREIAEADLDPEEPGAGEQELRIVERAGLVV